MLKSEERELMKKIKVVGIGNTLMSDDGVGVFTIEELARRYDLPENVELIDGGTKGIELLPYLEGSSKLLFIDAVNFGKEPGYIGEIEKHKVAEYFQTKLSVHQIALPDMLGAGMFLGSLPEEIYLIGIQPESVEIGYGLSPTIRERLDSFIDKIVEKLRSWGVYVSCNTIKDNKY
ncbi:MAG: hydrogenase maturation protease [Nitrospirae bacterium]|nr:MAG: hydrogenase maturation protease [Nitrospirota bacterium]